MTRFDDENALTPTTLLAEAERILGAGGYQLSTHIPEFDDLSHRFLLAEDAYGIVALVVYPTGRSLLADWPKAQGALVDALARSVPQDDPKAWEGYLVLLTLAPMSPDEESEASVVRRDTHRVRKYVFTSREIGSLGDVERALTPFLPLEVGPRLDGRPGAILESLPDLLAKRLIPKAQVESILGAFRNAEPLLESLDKEINR